MPVWAHNPRFGGSNPPPATKKGEMVKDRWACKECLVAPMCKKVCQRTKLYGEICYEVCSQTEIDKCTKKGFIIACALAGKYKQRMEGL